MIAAFVVTVACVLAGFGVDTAMAGFAWPQIALADLGLACVAGFAWWGALGG